MYDVYGVPAATYREACLIAGCDGPDHDFDEEFAFYEFAELGDIGLSFDEWRAMEARRAVFPQPRYLEAY